MAYLSALIDAYPVSFPGFHANGKFSPTTAQLVTEPAAGITLRLHFISSDLAS